MSTPGRPLRSVLFVPGSNPRAIDKARASEADAVVLDLEDMVAPDAKPAARDGVREALAAGGFGARAVVVRVNGLDTPWGRDDLAAVSGLGADALLVPKVETPAQVGEYLALADAAGGAALDLWLLAETPRAMLDLPAVAAASPRLRTILMGTQDLIKALRIAPDAARTGLVPLLSHAVVTARALGIAAIDGVHVDVKDEAAFAAVCRQGLALGFDGKALIHPAQVAEANAVFGRDAAPATTYAAADAG